MNLRLTPFQYIRHLDRLGLNENPFVHYEDQRYVYPLRDQRVAFDDVISSMLRKPAKNITFILANQGMGKTMLAKRLAESANSDSMLKVIGLYIQADEELIPSNLLKIISSKLGLPAVKYNSERLQDIISELQNQLQKNGKSLFLAIDGVLRDDTLTMLRKLSISAPYGNDNEEGSIVQIAMFRDKSPTDYSPKNLKVIPMLTNVNRTLGEPTFEELVELINMQIKAAGMIKPLFDDTALKSLINASKHNVEELLFLSDICLRYLCEKGQDIIIDEMVKFVLSDIVPAIRQPSLFSYEDIMKG